MQNQAVLAKSAVPTLPGSRISLVAKLQGTLKYPVYLVDHSMLNCREVVEFMLVTLCLPVAFSRSIST